MSNFLEGLCLYLTQESLRQHHVCDAHRYGNTISDHNYDTLPETIMEVEQFGPWKTMFFYKWPVSLNDCLREGKICLKAGSSLNKNEWIMMGKRLAPSTDPSRNSEAIQSSISFKEGHCSSLEFKS